MKSKKQSFRQPFIVSFSSTLLIFILFAVLFYIAYRMESILNLEPIAIFTLIDHQNGEFSYSFFNLKGSFRLDWLSSITNALNQMQAIIPPEIKLGLQMASATIEKGSQWITQLF